MREKRALSPRDLNVRLRPKIKSSPPLKLYKTAAIGRRRRDTDSETTQVNLGSPQVRQALWQSVWSADLVGVKWTG